MLRFVGGLGLGVILGLFLGSIPAVAKGLSDLGEILAWSALVTLL